MVDLSIIIVSWNTKEYLKKCLDSVYRQTKGITFQVWVVDNASSDGSPEMVQADYPQVRLIVNKENVGFARANNQALLQIKARFALLLNSDTVARKDAIYRLVEFMDKNSAVGIGGPRLVSPDNKPQPIHYIFPSLATAVFMYLPIKRLFLHQPRRPRPLAYVSGACLIIRQEVIDQIGLLEEEWFMYAEDADWCLRAKRAGWKIYIIPDAEVVHYSQQSAKIYGLELMSAEKTKNNYLFFKKHYNPLKVSLFVLITVSAVSLKITFSRVACVLLKSRTERILKRITVYQAILAGIKQAHSG
ncbi:glycosyltransferase family 2 protein [Candidatus Omnitrophota bacterium]